MRTSRKSSSMVKHAFVHFLTAILVLMLGPRQDLASAKTPNETGSRFLVLNDCDEDNNLNTAPYGDTVYMMDSRGEFIRFVARGLKVTSGYGGFSVSEDGRFFAICDRAANTLSVYEVAGRKLWSLTGLFNSAVFANGLVYTSSVDSLYGIDNTGTIVKHARIGVFNMTIHRARDCFWISGLKVRKFNLDLEPVLTVKRIEGIRGPIFVEANPDGSICLIQRNPYERCGENNRLVKVSERGRILWALTLDFCPYCVRVDKSNGHVWITGKIEGRRDFSRIGDEWPETLTELNELTKTEKENFTQKYNSRGNLLLSIPTSGHSLAVDPSDGSIWMAGENSMTHFSSTGEKLDVPTDLPKGRKWLALIPEAPQGR